ncbi:beta strand repeat-containing protein [Lysinibacter cavernae]|uniref:Adhesin/invasin n=1 Tax=Lysinibacter cavernae TaxID=1640652 RepID=A0A7X5R331_9MICO|nr:invasin domain 3-containing protein [Lysinibacter cavernae]NIH54671.1 adhesin/invasin [Lysinibacter cavernae]
MIRAQSGRPKLSGATPRNGKRALALVLSAVLALSGLGSLAVAQAPAAQAETLDNGFSQTYFVNDMRDVADANPGDGVCATRFTAGTPATATCTLYAAIQEANARPAGESILIAPAPQIRLLNGTFAPSAEIEINWNTTNNPAPQVPNMSTNMVADSGISGTIDADTASRYWIRHDNVTLDFQNRLGWSIVSDAGPNMLLFTGKDQTFRNFTKLTSAESGIYVGATAENFSLINGAVANPATSPALPSNYAIERGVVIVEGAKNTLIQNIHFQRSYWDAVLLAPASNSSYVINGLTIDRSSWDQPVNGGGYDPAYNFFVRNWNSAVSGQDILITNNTVRAWGADGGNSNVIQFLNGTWNNVMIRGNTFTATVNQSVNPIIFNAIGPTTSTVRDNTFISTINRSSTVDYSWVRSYGNTAGVQTFNNNFVGGNNAVQMTNQATTPATTTNPIFRNTMTRVSGTVTAANENTLTANNNIYNSANGTIRTTYPTLATVVDTPPQSCRIDLTIAPPGTGGTAIPTQEIYVDAYLGRTTASGGDNVGLEQYLGRISTTQAALPGVFSLPYTGAGAGNVVRLQTTEVATGRTSQYSRTIAATGADTCAPQSWIKQGGWFNEAGDLSSTQEDPTSFRNVSFDIRTSEPLGTNGLTESDIVFSGTAPGQQVVSLTQVSDTSWALVTKANGTGTIVPTIPTGAISDLAGNVSVDPSNTATAPINFAGYTDASQTTGIAGPDVDHSVLYNSPLAITDPTPLELTVAEPGTNTSTFRVSNLSVDEFDRVTKAPSATVFLNQVWSDLVPDATLPIPTPPQTAAGIVKALPTHDNLSTTEPTLDTIDRYVDVPVQAIDNLTVDGTRGATLNLQVTSDDPEFDGLLLSPVDVTVTDNDRPVAASSTLAVSQNNQLANGAAVNTLTATVQNADGALVNNASVTFSVPANTTWPGPDGTIGTGDDVVGPGTATILTGATGTALLALSSTTPGTYPVTASVNGTESITGSPQSVTFTRVPIDVASPDTNYTVSTGNAVADGSATHTITVRLIDGAGHPAAGWADRLAAVAAPATGVSVSGFAATATPGEYTATVTSTQAGAKGITVSLLDDDDASHAISLLAAGNPNAVFIAGTPVIGDGFSSVAIDDSNDRLADGSAFHQVTVVLADANHNPVTGAAARLSSSVADNTNGAVTVTAFAETGTPGTYLALVRSTEAGAQQVTAAFDGTLTIGTVTANFAAGAVDLGNPGSRFSVSSGNELVGTGQHTVTVTLADANGNPVAGQAATLSATSAGALGAGVITGFVETGTPGTYTATVTSTLAGGKVITARFGVSAITLAGNGTATFIADEVDLGNSSSGYTVSGGEVSVEDGEHGVTVTLADRFGNPVTGRAADLLAVTGDDLGTGAITAFVESAKPGTYLAVVTSSVSGEKTITVTLSGDDVSLTGNDVARFEAGGVDVDNIGTRYYVSGGDEVVSTGEHVITVTLSDALGNAVPGQADGILSTTLNDLGTGSISAFTETSTPGTYTATITSTVTGDKVVTTVFGAERLTVLLDGNDTATFVPAPVSPALSGFEVSTGSQTAGVGSHSVVIQLKDAFGNPVPGRAGDLAATTNTPDGVSIAAVVETGTPGTYSAVITSTTAGAKVISVTLDGDAITATGNDTALFAAGGVDLGNPNSHFSVSGGSVSVSGGSHSVTVTLADAFGNPVSGQAVNLVAATVDSLGSGAITNIVETVPGTYTATITSSVSGDKTITVTLGGADVTLAGNNIASFISGGVAPGNENTRYSVSSGNQTVGTGSHTISVTLADADGNPVGGQAAGLTGATSAGIGTGTISTFTESGTTPGTYTATISSSVSGGKPITVTFGAVSLTLEGNGTAAFVAGAVDPANTLTGYVVSGGQVSVAGGSHSVTVSLADAFGNPVSGQASLLTGASSANLGTGVISGFTEGGVAGTYTATITSSNAGAKPITVTLDGDDLTLRGNGTATFIAGGVDPGNAGTRFSVTEGSQPVGTGTHTVTVTLADADGNAVSGQAAGIAANTTGNLGTGAISAFTETGTPGTYIALVTSSVAGGKTITATFGGSGLTTVANNVANFAAGAVDPASPFTGFAVSAGEASVIGGTHTVTVTLSDTLGNPISGQAASLAATSSGDLGTGLITGFVETSTPGQYAATITSSIAGPKTIAATYVGTDLVALGNEIATFVAGDVDFTNDATNYSVSTGNQTVGTGEHTVTVTLADVNGNPVSNLAFAIVAATSDDLGAGAISAFTESETVPGTYTATVTSTLAGGKAITVTTNDEAVTLQGNGTATFAAAAVDLGNAQSSYSVSTGDETVVSGSHTVTVTLADEFGNPVPGQASELSATTTDDLGSGTVSGFTESGTTPGTYTASVTSSIAGTKALTATFSGDDITLSGNDSATFVAGAVDTGNAGTAYSVSAGDQPVSTGSHVVTVTLADAEGNAVSGQAGTLTAATTDPLGAGDFSVFTESGSTPGTYTASVTSTISGSKAITVTVGAEPVTLDGNGTAIFTSAAVDLTNDGSAYSVSTGNETVGTGSHTVTVTLADEFGNPVPGQAGDLLAETVDSLGTGSVSSFTESGTTPGTYTATVTSSVSGSKTITATLSGDPVTLSGNGVAVFVAGGVDLTNDGSNYSVSTGDASIEGGSHIVTVHLADALGNPVPGQAASLSADTVDDLGSGSITSFTEGAPGTYTATVTSSLAGGKTLTATFATEAITLDGNDVATFIAGGVDPDNDGTRYSVSAGDEIVNTGSHTVTVTLADVEGNPVPGQAVGLVASTLDDLGTGSIQGFVESPTTPGTYTATITSTVSGAKVITVTFGGSDITLDGNDTAVFIAAAVDPGNAGTSYSVSAGSETVGTGSHTVTVLLADAFGNPVPGQAATLTGSSVADLGTGVITGFTETATPGTYTATVTSSVSGPKPITVTVGAASVELAGNGTALFAPGEVDLGASGSGFSVSGGDASVEDGEHTVTVTLTDAFGNAVSGLEADLTASTSDDLGSGSVGAFVETGTAGTYTATITSSIAGGKTITVTLGTDAVTADGNVVATFIAGGVDPGNAGTRYSVSSGDETVGTGEHTITVTLADAAGNPVPGQATGLLAVTAADLGAGDISAFTEVSGTPGTYTATITSTIAGDKAVTVTTAGSAVTADGNTTATFVAAGVDLNNADTSFSVSTGDASVDGGSHQITVLLADEFGNPVSGQEAELAAATADSIGSGSISAFTESASSPGTYTATITSSVTGGKTVTATFATEAIALNGNNVATFIAGGVDPDNAGTRYSVSTGDETVSTGSHTITVTLADAEGNPAPGQAAGLTADTVNDLGVGSISGFTEVSATPGTYTATVTSTVSGDKAITVLFGASPVTLDGNGSASFVAGAIDYGNAATAYAVSTGDETVGTGEHTVTVTLADTLGNPVPGQAAGLVGATVDGLGTGGISGFTESGTTPGTYTATITSTIAGEKTITVSLGVNTISASGNVIASFISGGVDLGNGGTSYAVSTGDVSVSGGVHEVTVTLADEFGNAVSGQAAGLAATTVDDLGSGSITTFTEVAGTPGTYTAEITSSVSGGKTITVTLGDEAVSAAGNSIASFIAGGVDPGNAGTRYTVSTGDQTVGTGEHTITVTLADADGNPVPGQAIGLAATTTDPIGTGDISPFTEDAGTPGTYTATVSSSIAGDKTITVQFGASSVTATGNTVATFVAGSVDLSNPGSGYSVSTGDETVGTGAHTVTVTLADSLGNPVPGQSAELDAATVSGLGTGSITNFAEDAGTPGTYTATITSTVAGGKVITVDLASADVPLVGNDTAVFIAAAVDLANGGTVYTVSTGNETVGTGSHTVTVTLLDSFGNGVTGAAGLLVGSATGLGTGSVSAFAPTGTDGVYTATVTSSVAGDKPVSVTYDGDAVTASGNTSAVFVSGGVDLSNPATSYTVSTGDATVGTGSHTVTVTLADSFGNPVSGQAADLEAATASNLGTGIITGFVESATAGTYTATVTSTVSGAKPIAATLNGDTITLAGNGSATFVPAAVDLGNGGSGFAVSGGDVSVSGGSHLVTITLVDAFGNPVPGQASDLLAATADSLGSGSITAVSESSTTPGTYTASVTSSVAGGKTITVTFGGDDVTASGNVVASFIAGGVDPGNDDTGYVVSTGDQTVGTGSHTVTVTLADADGNPVPGQAAGLTGASVDPLGTGSVSAFTESATVPGTYEATVTSSVAGEKAITVLFGAAPLTLRGNGTATFVAAAVDLGNAGTRYGVSTGDQVVGAGSHTVTITLADGLGNPVSGQATALLAATSGSLGAGSITTVIETATPGTYTASITSTVAGSKPVTVSFGGDAVTASGNTSAVFIAAAVDPNADGTSYSVSGGDASVEGGLHLITVVLVDAFGNPAPSHASEIAASTAADLGTGAISAFTETGTPGTYTATVTSSIAGDKAITATVNLAAITLNGNGTATFTAGGVDPTNPGTSFSVSTGTRPVGAGAHTVTVLLADAAGNPVPGQAACLTASTLDPLGAGLIDGFTETVPGTYEADIHSTIAGEKTITVTCGATAIAADGNDVAEFVANTVDPGDSGTDFGVSIGNQIVGSGSHTVTVHLADEFGNPVSGLAAMLTASTTDPLGTGVVTGFVESATTPGEYVATITSTVAGVKHISVEYNGIELSSPGIDTASFIAAAVDLTADGTSYSVSGGSVSVSGGSHTVTVTLADEFGNPVPGQAAQLVAATAADLGTGTVTAVTESATPGTYTATVTSSIAGGKAMTVEFSGSPVTLNGNDTATFVAGGVDPGDAATRYSVSGGVERVGTGSHTVTVTLADASGNPVSGQAAGLTGSSSASLGTGGISAFTETGTPGTYEATITSTVAGAKAITVAFGGSALTLDGNGTALFSPGNVDPNHAGTVYSVSPGAATVGTGSHTVTVTVVDEFGNPVSGVTDLAAATSAALGAGTISAFTETGTPGTYAAIITSTIAGAKPVTVTLGAESLNLSGNGNALFVSAAVDPSRTTVTATSPVAANGSDFSVVTVSLFDQYGNPVTQQVPVTVTTTLGSASASAYQGNGIYTAQVRSTVDGTATASATINGVPSTASAEIVFTDSTPPTPPVVDPTDGNEVTGCAEPGSTVTVYDSAGNVIGTAVAGDDCRFVVTLSPPQEPGSEITITVTDPDGNVSEPITVRVGLIWMTLAADSLRVGATQRAFGHNFQPGEVVSGLLQSDPIDLGTQVADANGDVTFEVRIPAGFDLGRHTITLTGDFSGSVSESFTVIGAPEVAVTGADDVLPVTLGGLVLILGGFVLVAVRRRREDTR